MAITKAGATAITGLTEASRGLQQLVVILPPRNIPLGATIVITVNSTATRIIEKTAAVMDAKHEGLFGVELLASGELYP